MAGEPLSGFPSRAEFTPVPALFLTRIAPQISDMVELKTCLYVMHLLYRKKGYPRFVSLGELAADVVLAGIVAGDGTASSRPLNRVMDAAVARGVFLRLNAANRAGRPEQLIMLNDDPGRRAAADFRSGELALPSLEPVGEAAVPVKAPNIYSLYEENIGILTPMIAEELRAAEKAYPADWIEDAFREAAALNKRNWRYIARILENWSTEGKGNGKPRGYPQRRYRPEDYYKGKLGRLARR